MSDNQEREEAHTGDISDDSIATRQGRRTRSYNRVSFWKKSSEKKQGRRSPIGPSSKASKTTPISHLERLWNVIEIGEYENLMEAQRFFEFLTSAWAKAATPSLDKMVSARKRLDRNVQAKGVDRERGA